MIGRDILFLVDMLKKVNVVDDLEELLSVMDSEELTEFQYIVNGDEWTISIK